MEKLTAVWLLPIVASEVAAASGEELLATSRGPEAFLVLILQLRPLGVLGAARRVARATEMFR